MNSPDLNIQTASTMFAARLSSIAQSPIDLLLVLWFVTTPLASFYIRFPQDRSVITYDRIVFALVTVLLLVKWRRGAAIRPNASQPRPFLTATPFEIAWALLAILALLSALLASSNLGYATKIAVDSFCLPILAFHVARQYFDLRKQARALTLAAIVLAWFLFATGAFEFFSGSNLFPYKGSDLLREGERRVNGPFASDSSFAIICLLVSLFLAVMPRVLRVRLDATARLVYAGALAAGLAASLLPLFRAVVFAIVICLAIVEISLLRRRGSEAARVNDEGKPGNSIFPRFLRLDTLTRPRLIVFAVILLGLVAAESLSGASERRLADPRSAYGRLATWAAAAEVSLDNPVFGVGLTNYSGYFDKKYNWSADSPQSFLDVRAADTPHSNPLWILSEMGLIGFVLYILANAYILVIGYRGLKRADSDQLRVASIGYLAVTLAYWIPGFTLASGYYSDLNLYFFFILGVLSNRFLVSGSDPNQ